MSEPGGTRGDGLGTGGDGLRGRATASSVRTFVLACVRACVRAWSVDRLLGTRDVRARNCVPVLKLFISPTTADPRRTAHGPGTNGASPSGMIMHRSASHYTYTYPVYPAPILPTRYVDYTTSSPPLRTPLPPSHKPAQ